MRYHTHRESDYPVINERNHVTRLPLHAAPDETDDYNAAFGRSEPHADFNPTPGKRAWTWRTHLLIVLFVLGGTAICFICAWLKEVFRR